MIEIDVVSEVYTILKQYIPSKDRQEAADNLVSVLVDMISDDDLDSLKGTDNLLAKAVKSYSREDEDDDDSFSEDE